MAVERQHPTVAFALRLMAAIQTPAANLAFSPSSIDESLRLLLAGAADETAAELTAVLGEAGASAGGHPPEVQLVRANGLFVDRTVTLHPAYASEVEARHGATSRPVDFAAGADAAVAEINAWVAEHTRGRVSRLLSPHAVRASTLLMLVNAVYFKAEWLTKFSQAQTATRPFTLLDGQQVGVPTMHLKTQARAVFTDMAAMLELPYIGQTMAFYAVLPAAGATIDDLQGWLTAPILADGLRRMEASILDVRLPKLSIEDAVVRLADALRKLGVRRAFEAGAQLSKVTDAPVFIDEVVHKTFLRVTEEGTEAAAATGMFAQQSISRTPVFAVDRPFLFFIRDLTDGSILFMGRVTDPRAS